MPSKSKAQQKAMGMAYAAKTGKIPKKYLRSPAKEMMEMNEEDLKEFAKTKGKGLRRKVKKNK